VRGDLTVGGSAVGAVVSVVRSTPGTAWLPRTALDSNLRFSPTATLREGSYHVCFATRESGGLRASDFVALRQVFARSATQFAGGLSTQRVVVGAGPHDVVLEGGLGLGDELFLQEADCNASLPVGPRRSAASTVAGVNVTLVAASTLQEGIFRVCRREAQATAVAEVLGLHFEVGAAPSFSPLGGVAGEATVVTVGAPAVPGDLIVLKGGGCAGAHSTGNSSLSLGPTALDSNLQVATSVGMTGDGSLHLCYAPQASLGDEETDYVSMGEFLQSTVEWEL